MSSIIHGALFAIGFAGRILFLTIVLMTQLLTLSRLAASNMVLHVRGWDLENTGMAFFLRRFLTRVSFQLLPFPVSRPARLSMLAMWPSFQPVASFLTSATTAFSFEGVVADQVVGDCGSDFQFDPS